MPSRPRGQNPRPELSFPMHEFCRGGVSVSEMGTFSQCLVDSDAEARGRARSLRRKAVALSLLLEALLLGAMLIWPLITPGVLPRQYVVDPIPPIGGSGKAGKSHSAKPLHPPPPRVWRPLACRFCAPPVIPAHPDTSGDTLPPDISSGDTNGGDGGPGRGTGRSWNSRQHRTREPARYTEDA